MSDIVVIARAHAAAGKEEELMRALDAVTGPTHADPACLRYALHRGLEDPGTFVMIERYASKDAFDAHMASAHVQQLFAQLGGLVDGPPEMLVLTPVNDDVHPKAKI
jgi:quinol monooxygenase YgiN